jgi:PPOX class probable F420-dependent enzyme
MISLGHQSLFRLGRTTTSEASSRGRPSRRNHLRSGQLLALRADRRLERESADIELVGGAAPLLTVGGRLTQPRMWRMRQNWFVSTLEQFAQLAGKEHGLVVISTVRANGSVQSSLVNAGVMPHPISEQPRLTFVTYGKVKLGNLRRRPQLAATARAGWEWVSVEGRAEIIGPDDPDDGVDSDRLRLLLREAFTCAGGTHGDWAEYDRVMTEQRRALVLVDPQRIYSNPRP